MKNITKSIAQSLITVGDSHANTDCVLFVFYEPKIPANLLKKQK